MEILYLRAFFGKGLSQVDNPYYSHIIRWEDTARTKRFFSNEQQQAIEQRKIENLPVPIPSDFMKWHPLHRAQYLEITVFLSQYLLSSQGDRVAMANSVEGRFPFLDYRVVEFCNRLPPGLKLRGLTEKYLLKRLARRWLPDDIWRRPKRPYRAPIHRSFFNPVAAEYVYDLLSDDALLDAGLFKPAAVRQLASKVENGASLAKPMIWLWLVLSHHNWSTRNLSKVIKPRRHFQLTMMLRYASVTQNEQEL